MIASLTESKKGLLPAYLNESQAYNLPKGNLRQISKEEKQTYARKDSGPKDMHIGSTIQKPARQE
jgi:hypothetical protein